MNDGKMRQGTVVGVISCVASVIPIVGIVINIIVFRLYDEGTNAHTLSIIGVVISALVGVLMLVLAAFFGVPLFLLHGMYNPG